MYKWLLSEFRQINKDSSNFIDLGQNRNIISHFTDFGQVKKLLFIWLWVSLKNYLSFYWLVLRSKQNLKKFFYSLEIFLRCVGRLWYRVETFIAVYGVETFVAVYGVEIFLHCNLRCQDFSTMWRLSVQRASYGLWTRFTVGEHDRILVFYLFGHRAIHWVIN